MRQNNSTGAIFPSRKTKLYGDIHIAYGIINSKIYMHLLAHPKGAIIKTIKTYFHFNTAMLSYSVSSFFHFRFGAGVTLSLIHISEPRDLSTSRMPSSA